jgi:hypothetical protein
MRGALHPVSRSCNSAAAVEDVMDEGTSKAIPLRRSRAATRTVTARPFGLTERLTFGVRQAMSPPHQLWLATLGSAALTVRGVRIAWSHLVSEGAAVEGWLRRTLGGGVYPEARG